MHTCSPLPLGALPLWEAPPAAVEDLYETALAGFSHKIIVLDDDPTGVQTVHGVSVYTDWSPGSVLACFQESAPVSFLLTNSRSFPAERTKAVHREIGENICRASAQTGRDYVLISRGDSTLRGHWPLETQILAETLAKTSGSAFDGEILLPFFEEGGRYTFGNVHYVREGQRLIPVGESEFARDAAFGYTSSDLTCWCAEKTAGAYPADACICIPLEDLRSLRVEKVCTQLLSARNFEKIIVNAVCYEDLKVFCAAYVEALHRGRRFLFRSAASWVRVLGGISERPLLTHPELVSDSTYGGVVLAGSYVKKTTAQLEHLKTSGLPLHFLEFHLAGALDGQGLEQEAARIAAAAEALILQGTTVVIYTSRERISPQDAAKEQQLAVSAMISDAVTGIIGRLTVRPAFIVAKGGITSSDVGVKALHVRRALVMGQIMPGIPVWRTGAESKFPRLPYVIFPGNVGGEDTLTRVVRALMDR